MDIQEDTTHRGTVEISITLERADIERDLQRAAQKIGASVEIAGFRKGAAPYDVVCRHVGGEAAVYQEALQGIVSRTLAAAVADKEYELFGQPEISVEKMTPPFGIVFKAVLALRPEVTLGDVSKIKEQRKPIAVSDADIQKVIDNLRDMRVSESATSRPARTGDKVMVDFDISRDQVSIEGGQAKQFPLVLGEGRFIPGFEDAIAGMKSGETKTFEVTFPKEYHAAHLAGKKASVTATVTQVFERALPAFDDQFAQGLGHADTADGLRAQIADNLKHEKEAEEHERFHMACMDALVACSTIGDISDAALDEEVHKMEHELEESIGRQGMELDKYLASIKKTKDDLRKDFRPKAEHRLKIGLVANAFRKDRDITVDDADVDAEIAVAKKAHANQPEYMSQIQSPAYRDYSKNALISRRVFEVLASEVEKSA